MAYTKIFAIRADLSYTLRYAVNPEKTTGMESGLPEMVDYALNPKKTEERLFTSALGCQSPETALAEMQATKQRFGKTGGILGYHIIQSFKPGEVEPALAHEIGVELARRCFGEKYETVVGTHLDRGHLHSHIVINSVSCVDGGKYHSNRGSYHRDIRGISDQLCREYGLSVIGAPAGRGKHYAEWQAEKEGRSTGGSMVRADIDDAIRVSYTFADFIRQMRKRGYGVRCGPNVKHMALKPGGGQKFYRVDTFRDPRYTEAGIKERIAAAREGRQPCFVIGSVSAQPKSEAPVETKSLRPATTSPLPPVRLPPSRPWRKPRKLHGFVALYWKYCYLLRETMHRKLPPGAAFFMHSGTSLREETRRFARYQRQFLYLYRHKLETPEDLQSHRQEKEKALGEGIARRKALYAEKREASESRKTEITAEIATLNEELRGLRGEIRLCAGIEQDAQRLQEVCTKTEAVMETESQKQTGQIKQEKEK